MHIRVDDIVEVITGEDRRRRGKVLKVLHDEGKVLVEGVNRVYRHIRRSQKNPQGAGSRRRCRSTISNVRLVCTSCGKPSRVGARFAADGAKERYCKSCDAALGTLSPARAAAREKKVAFLARR